MDLKMLLQLTLIWMIFSIIHGMERSNFLFIIVDDLRPALGCYGDSKAFTPNIDRLARRGVVFNKTYAQQALCAPSRNSLLTSRRPETLKLYDFYSYWRKIAGNFTTLPQHLKENGYTTASFGKVFHPGKSSNYNDDSPYSWTEHPFHPESERYKDAPVCGRRDSLPASNLVCPVDVSAMPNATLPDIETLRAVKKFLKTVNRKEPFFAAVGFQKPHIPLKYPKKYLQFHPLKKFSVPNNYKWPNTTGRVAYNTWMDLRRRSDIEKLNLECPWERIPEYYARKIIQSYYAAVTYIDDLVGELLHQLHVLNIRKNTVVILTSDHGWSLGEHGTWAKYSNFEVALRVPLIISIPDLTFDTNDDLKVLNNYKYFNTSRQRHDNKNIDNPVELLDIFPTIAELANIPLPSCPRVNNTKLIPNLCTEGSSLLQLIRASPTCEHKIWKNVAISQYPRPGLEPECNSRFDEPRFRDITVMGYTFRTSRYRYTAWLPFLRKTNEANWKKILAEELYDHATDDEEDVNIGNLEITEKFRKERQSTLLH